MVLIALHWASYNCWMYFMSFQAQMMSCMCSEVSIAQEESFPCLVDYDCALKFSMQLGLVTRAHCCLCYFRFFFVCVCVCTGFFSEKPLSNNPPAQTVTQCYYIPDVELWIYLCWNSLKFFVKKLSFIQRWEEKYMEKLSWRKKTET